MDTVTGKVIRKAWVTKTQCGEYGWKLIDGHEAMNRRETYRRQGFDLIRVAIVELADPAATQAKAPWFGRWENCRRKDVGELCRYEWNGDKRSIAVRFGNDRYHKLYSPEDFAAEFEPI